MTYVFDACALIAVFSGEIGAENIKNIINSNFYDNRIKIIMHKANLLEVYYDILKRYNKTIADKIIKAFVDNSNVKIISEISDEIFIEAGRLKSNYKISFADTFALATALVYNGKLVTSDHHEFDLIEKYENIQFYWFR
jgi:predicted nucleic acid-binding protein